MTQVTMNPADKKKLATTGLRFHKGTLKGVKKGMKMLQESAKRFDGSNQLRIRTGKLRDSIDYSIKDNRSEIVAFLGSDALYARIHEFGGTITARRSKHLVFLTNSGWRRVKSVTIPPRPFLITAISKNKDKFAKIVNEGAVAGWKGRLLGIF